MEKIHACINDSILYRGEKYDNLEECPVCTTLQYKIRQDNPGDVEGDPQEEGSCKVCSEEPSAL